MHRTHIQKLGDTVFFSFFIAMVSHLNDGNRQRSRGQNRKFLSEEISDMLKTTLEKDFCN
jgi:hypothetical protein